MTHIWTKPQPDDLDDDQIADSWDLGDDPQIVIYRLTAEQAAEHGGLYLVSAPADGWNLHDTREQAWRDAASCADNSADAAGPDAADDPDYAAACRRAADAINAGATVFAASTVEEWIEQTVYQDRMLTEARNTGDEWRVDKAVRAVRITRWALSDAVARDGGMLAGAVLKLLSAWGRPIERSTWDAYVARGQAPAAAKRIGRTPLWDLNDIRTWFDGLRAASTD